MECSVPHYANEAIQNLNHRESTSSAITPRATKPLDAGRLWSAASIALRPSKQYVSVAK